MIKQALESSEYNTFYSGYISLVPHETALIKVFENDTDKTLNFFKSIPKGKLDFRYAEGKWSIKEVFQHVIDTERVFQFRCLHIARQDKTPIPGFEQNNYIIPSGADKKSLESLIEEFSTVRQSFIALLKSLTTEDLLQVGSVSGFPMSARAAAFIVIGHYYHHMNIINERYL